MHPAYRGELPGYYWDDERGKYFIIKPGHHYAPPSQAKYSEENVMRQKRKATAEGHARREQEQIERLTIKRPYIEGKWGSQLANMERETGVRPMAFYMHTVWPNACVSLVGRKKKVVEQPKHGVIRFFDRDPRTKTLYAVHGDNAIRRRYRNPPDGVPLPDMSQSEGTDSVTVPGGKPLGPAAAETLNEYSFAPWDMLARLTSSISSLNYLPSSGALAATTLGSDRAPVVYLSDPDVDGPYVNQQFTPKNCGTILGAAAAPLNHLSSNSSSIPQADTERLAVAASKNLLMFMRSPAGDWTSSTPLTTDTDVLTVDWLSPTTAILGERNGKIRLYDTRSKGSSHILTHPFPVGKLKRADDETRVVCAGIQNSLVVYDIRSRSTMTKDNEGHYTDRFFVDHYPGPHMRKKRKLMKQREATTWSQPILSFSHGNEDDQYVDLAVEPSIGLIAASQDQYSDSAIKIHNMWTGKLVKEIPQQKPIKVNIRCLRFMQDDNGDPELWSTWGGSVVRWNFG